MSQSPSDNPIRKPNRLIGEQSPYLRQHAYNPVDWYPWGEEALTRARAENRPILLSIGYSACHWCHVMERESFENEEIARQMNENFIAIKVDREERPDLDQIYMDAVQLLTGRGGWPLTMFLTPEGNPFYGGTYFPPVDRHGLPGFPRLLAAIANAYQTQPEEVRQNVERLTQAMGSVGAYQPSGAELPRGISLAAARELGKHYDSAHGGIGGAPKFPNTFVFSLFLRMYDADGDVNFADMVRDTLSKMAKGGIYDQLGGGFHRYSVDERWLVPHFEKMLYDNALLARLYLDAGRALNEPDFLRVAREILDYVLREMTAPEGGFYATQDADSEGEEGKFFVWTPAEALAVLGENDAKLARRWFDISEAGNFEGANILHRTIDPGDAAKMFGVSGDELAAALERIRGKLLAARENRIKPARDEKILAAWNGMMIGALAEGYRTLSDARYLAAAERAIEFTMTRLWDGRALKRSYKDGVARFNAYLEDYALMANAMIDTYEASLAPRYLELARTLAEVILERFSDRERGGFYFTSDDHETLITRAKAAFDGSTPSGNSAAVMALLRLHAYTGEERYAEAAARTLDLFGEFIEKQPFAFAHMLEAADLYHRGPVEIVVVGDRASAEFREWIERSGLIYLPNRAIFAVDAAAGGAGFVPEAARGKKAIDGRLTAYVCRERTCSAPITTFDQLVAALSD
ncbi:MAG: thioredoxin domain-containing protein [Candidatus Binataceae bacterium]|nr:thioredoxin domain-containing protein [Candidatus Binataceae bacterium]